MERKWHEISENYTKIFSHLFANSPANVGERFFVNLLNIWVGKLNKRKSAKRSHGEVVRASVMSGELFGKVIQGVKAVTGVEAFLGLPVAALYLAVVVGCVEAMSLWRTPRSATVFSNREGRPCLPERNQLENFGLLLIWTRSTWIPRRACHFIYLSNMYCTPTKILFPQSKTGKSESKISPLKGPSRQNTGAENFLRPNVQN